MNGYRSLLGQKYIPSKTNDTIKRHDKKGRKKNECIGINRRIYSYKQVKKQVQAKNSPNGSRWAVIRYKVPVHVPPIFLFFLFFLSCRFIVSFVMGGVALNLVAHSQKWLLWPNQPKWHNQQDRGFLPTMDYFRS